MKKQLIFILFILLLFQCKTNKIGERDFTQVEKMGLQELVDFRKTLPRCTGTGEIKLQTTLPFVVLGLETKGGKTSLILNRKKTSLKYLQNDLENVLESMVNNKEIADHQLSNIVIVLMVSKSVSYQEVETLIEECKRLELLRIFYNCNEGTIAANLKGLPFFHRLYEGEQKSLDLSQLVYDKFNPPKENEEETMPSGPIPPPPPPPPARQIPPLVSELLESDMGIVYNKVQITKNGFIYNGNSVANISTLDSLFDESLSMGAEVFVLSPDADASYDDYYNTLARLKWVYKKVWNEHSQAKYGINYDVLIPSQKKKILDKLPYLLIHEYLYERQKE